MEQAPTTQEEENIPPDTTDKNKPTDSEEQSKQAEAGKSEEPTQYHVKQETVSGPVISPHGSGNVIINNFNYAQASQDIRGVWERPYEGENDEEEDETGQVVLKKNVRFARQNRAHFDTPLPADDTSPSQTPPDDEKHLSVWYYRLEEYVQCYVLAVTLLHGATAREIYRRTDELYRLTLQEKQNTLEQMTPPRDASSDQTSQTETPPPPPTFAFPRPASLDLQKQTGTLSHRENGAERLFWHDVTETGYSPLETRMLTFLAREYNRKGEHWDGFFKLVRSWSEQKRGSRGNIEESSWRSTRALGAILWYQNITELRRLAEVWAKKDSFSGRQLATSLLHGAYEIEQWTQGKETPSAIHQLLQEWIVRLQDTFTLANINLGCSVASMYGLLIVSGNDIADTTRTLHYLDDLLRLQEYGNILYIQKLMATVSSTYVSLSLAGYIRQILCHLASIMEKLVYYRESPQKLQDRNVFRWQRGLRLYTALDAFFLIATTLRSQGDQESQWDGTVSKYLQPLEESVPFDTDYRDILLVGLLTEDTLAEPLKTLLCAAMFSKRSKPVSELLTHWTSIVLAIKATQRPTTTTVYTRFSTFLVDLGHEIQRWSREIRGNGYRQPVAYDAYRQQIWRWIDNKRASNDLIELGNTILDGLEQRKS
jgi:hypothetical protein